MRYTVILVPDDEAQVSAKAHDATHGGYLVILVPDDEAQVSGLVPATPGCLSGGTSRDDALAHAREAMALCGRPSQP